LATRPNHPFISARPEGPGVQKSLGRVEVE
jgi:hypothetical protein